MSNFVINNAYLSYLGSTNPLTAFLKPTLFKLGSGVAYTPTEAQASLTGTILYTGALTSRSLGSGVTDILISVPPGVGPFDFGEIGLYLSDGTLMAVYAYDTLVNKSPSAASGVNSVISIHCLLKLAQGTASLTVSSSPSLTIPVYSSFGDVIDPASTGSDLAIVRTAQGPVTFLERSSATAWNISDHERIATNLPLSNVATVSGKTVFQVSGVDTSNTSVQNRYIVHYQGKLIRAQTIAGTGLMTSEDLSPWAQNGLLVELWERTAAKIAVHLAASDPHPQYLTSSEASAAYLSIAHTSASDPHTQYLKSTDATIQYVPASHLADANPHPQYILSTTAANQFLPRSVNTLIADASGQSRFRFLSPGGSPGMTEFYGRPDAGGSVFEFQRVDSSGGVLTVGRIYNDGRLEAPAAAIPPTSSDKTLATTEWAVNRLKTPTIVSLAPNAGVDYPLSNFHEIVSVNFNGMLSNGFNVPVALQQNAVYEVTIVIAANGRYSLALTPNGGSASVSASNFWYDMDQYFSTGNLFMSINLNTASTTGNSTVRMLVYNFADNKQIQYDASSQSGPSRGSSMWTGTTQWTSFGFLGKLNGSVVPTSFQWSVQIKRVM